MKGTAILFNKDLTVTFFENVDQKTIKSLIKKSIDDDDYSEKEELLYNEIEQALWLQEEIDWDYGY